MKAEHNGSPDYWQKSKRKRNPGGISGGIGTWAYRAMELLSTVHGPGAEALMSNADVEFILLLAVSVCAVVRLYIQYDDTHPKCERGHRRRWAKSCKKHVGH